MIYLILAMAGFALGAFAMYRLVMLAGRISGAIEAGCKGAVPFR